ncbi:uncharacterized protein LOC134783817 [Penaeus indicus]|uniref:uncharacterized protein LOC134783817 n=1 Tax=Penaeus indicus TaxID=29960 RepID=UPI00300DBE1E
MEDERGIVLRKERQILMRWKDYFEKLLKEENERFPRGDGEPNNQEVAEVTRQEVITALKEMKNGRENYKEYGKEAKRAVAIAKAKAYDSLYEELDTEEGQGKDFKLAKQRNKSTKDIKHIRQMEDE